MLWTIRRTCQAGGEACDPAAAPVVIRRSDMREQGGIKSNIKKIGIPCIRGGTPRVPCVGLTRTTHPGWYTESEVPTMRDLVGDHGHIEAMSGPLMLTAVHETGTRDPGIKTTLASSLGSFKKPRETSDHQPFWGRTDTARRESGGSPCPQTRLTPPICVPSYSTLASSGSGAGACPSSHGLAAEGEGTWVPRIWRGRDH